jgi:thiol:disulfide interchange protein DsbD
METNHLDYENAIEKSTQLNKLLLILFTSSTCENPVETNKLLKHSKKLTEIVDEEFIFLQLFVDDNTPLDENEIYLSKLNKRTIKTVGARNTDFEKSMFDSDNTPFYVVLDKTEKVIKTSNYLETKAEVVNFLKSVLNNN